MFQPSLTWPKKVSFLFLFICCFLFLASFSYAIELQSPRFKLDLNQIEVNTDKQAEPVIYTIANVYGSQKYNEFNNYGYVIASQSLDDSVSLSLSDSLLVMTESDKEPALDLGILSDANRELIINMIQIYTLRNFSGDNYNLEYSLKGSDIFRSLPVQDSGQTPTNILKAKENDSTAIMFRLEAQPQSIGGTYETVINFIASPEL